MNFFVITADRNWGHSTNSLAEALSRAAVRQQTRLETYAEHIECCFADNETSKLSDYLEAAKVSWLDEKEEEKYRKPLEITLVVVGPEWKLAGVCGMGGTPSWLPAEEGTKPEFKIEQINLLVKPDGTIAKR
jgi:hypothetical protein